ncbi:hypothetical protein LOTGIDRAFT_159431 [Lottia gigantea]|uniref:Odorant receptor n=1 Tax=Lottia gigantea TaxID=225164 RepID=V4ARG3_LOTGI|nr:hypothetical protein LOTGIDRAFT_159431 [Lottia gigantea]ESO97400.1 hypothetical protein LOTGIDRAFT_159431 [Lottia gigantea]
MEAKKASEMECSDPITDPLSTFQPILTFGRVVGLFGWVISPTEKRCSLKKFLCWFQFVFVQIIVWGIVLKYIIVMYMDIHSARLIPILALVSYHVGSAYVPTLTYISSTKHFRQLLKVLNEYHTLFEPFQKMRSLKKYLKPIIAFNSFNGFSNSVMFCVLVSLPYREEMARLMYPFNFSDVKNSIMAYLFLGSSQLFSLLHLNLMFSLTCALSYLLIFEFKHITKKLKIGIEKFNSTELKDVAEFEQFLEKIRQQHNLVVEILEATNSLLKHYFFTFFAVAIPMICFSLYGVIRSYLAMGEIIFCFMTAYSFALCVSIFSIVGAQLNFKAHEPLEVLMFIDLSSINDKTYRTVRK